MLSGVLLSGCATLPSIDPAPPLRTTENLASDTSLATDDGQFPEDRWWTRYGDPALDGLIEEGLRQSPDIQIAAARIDAADALAEQAGAVFWPRLTAEGTAGGVKQSYNMGIPEQFVPKGVVSTGQIAARLNFNLDLWGRNRAALAAARGEAAAARVDAAQARLMLTTSIATAWAEFGQLLMAQDLAAQAAELRADTARLTQARVDAGIDSQSDLALAQSRAAAANADLAAAQEAVLLTRHRIAALLGAGPDRGETLPKPNFSDLAVAGVPAQLAANLLGRRPDIVSARLRVEAADQRVKAAKRSFYPDINLTALAGVQSLGLSNLFDNGSRMANFGPAISLPLFDGGVLTGRYRGASAAHKEAVARYDQTLIAALRETADILASRRAVEERLGHLRMAAQSATAAANLAAARYQSGIGNLLQANTAQDAALAARRALLDAQSSAFKLDTALIRALGGGYSDHHGSKDPTRP